MALEWAKDLLLYSFFGLQGQNIDRPYKTNPSWHYFEKFLNLYGKRRQDNA